MGHLADADQPARSLDRRTPGRMMSRVSEPGQLHLGDNAVFFRNGEGIGKALADDLFRPAEAVPLLLAIDTYERADRHDDWLRANVLADASDKMLVVIAGRNGLDEGYRRTFGGDLISLVRSYNLNDQTFQRSEVMQYLSLRLNPTEDLLSILIDEVLAISRRVPVVVEALGDQLAAAGTLTPYQGMELGNLDRRRVIRSVTDRFLWYAMNDEQDKPEIRSQKQNDRQYIRSLSILRRPDAELTCASWGVSTQDGQQRIDRLSEQYSFIFAGFGL
jgi:hypothetical protein